MQRPDNVREVADGLLPQGFRAAGVACGIKPDGAKDLALIVSDAPEHDQRRALQPLRRAVGAGAAHTRRREAVGAAGGGRQLRQRQRRHRQARVSTTPPRCGRRRRRSPASTAHQVAVASTGVIGVPLPIEQDHARDRGDRCELRPDGGADFAEAIRTTDAFPKQVTLDVALAAGTVRLSVQAKGAGMISPNFATLLVFVQTDAEIEADEADLLLSVCTQAFVRPDQRRRAALHLGHDRAAGLGSLRCADRAQDRR